jgi:uncharacterized membrane protein
VKDVKRTITINKPIDEVFTFAITPPNSSRWIPGVVDEKTNEWPMKVGTVYSLRNESGQRTDVIVTAIEQNQFVEWASSDGRYHCKYTFRAKPDNITEFEYHEWMDDGELEEPFTVEALEKLKEVIEADI